MSLSAKIEEARGRIRQALRGRASWALMASFGKDSLVLIDLLAEFGVRNAYFLPHIDDSVDLENKLAIIQRYGLTVTNLPQGRAFLSFAGPVAQMIAMSSVGQVLFPVPIEMTDYDGRGAFSCADDMMRADQGEVAWQLRPEVLFWGHKLADLEERDVEGCFRLYGQLGAETKRGFHARTVPSTAQWKLGSIDCCSPLIDWTKDDVWDYIERFELPISSVVYDGRERRKRPIPVCYRCHDPAGPASIECPKTRKILTNLSHFTQDGDFGITRLERLGIFSAEEASELTARDAVDSLA